MSGFPQRHNPSTVSHWQATNRGEASLWLHGSKDTLPSEADIVVVGGGLTGAFLSYYLTRPGSAGEGKTVVTIEAKDVGSGASGRNGGHLAPASSFSYPSFLVPVPNGPGLSPPDALFALEHEYKNYLATVDLIKENAIEDDVDLFIGQSVSVIFDKEKLVLLKEAKEKWIKARLAHGLSAEEEDVTVVDNAAEAQRISRCPSAVGCVVKRAGSVHPHKLLTEVFKLALKSTTSKFSLFTHTHLVSFESHTENNDITWTLETSKGTLVTPTMILATNAHTPSLFSPNSPIAKFIYPCRGNAATVVPPPNYSGKDGRLKYTYGFSDGPYFVDTKGGGLVLGAGWGCMVDQAGLKKKDMIGQTDDSFVLKEVKQYFGSYCKKVFADWEEAPGEGMTRIWTGIMGYTKDFFPLIGPVPDTPGLVLACGFHGHGMSRIVTCARAVAHQLKTLEWDDRIPKAFAVSEERFKRVEGVEISM